MINFGLRIPFLVLSVASSVAFGAFPELLSPPTVSPILVVGDETTPCTVSMTIRDGDGYNDIRQARVLFNYTEAEPDSSRGRGYMAWAVTDAEITRYGGAWVLADAAGGGRWGYLTDNWGGTQYMQPTACSVSTDGNASGGMGTRTVTWTFTAKPAWGFNPLVNDADAWYADATTIRGWTDSPNSFDVVPAACAAYAQLPRQPQLTNITSTSIDITLAPNESSVDVFAIRISPSLPNNEWVKKDGTRGRTPTWQTRSEWGTAHVGGLLWNTDYTFEVRAARIQSGYCPSEFGPAAVATTLPHVPVVDWRKANGFDVWVRGQCPYRMIATSTYPLLWSITEGSLARGLAGGLDADTYDWRNIYSGSNWGQGGGAYTTLQFLQYARDYQASPMLTANAFGGGYKDGNNDGVFVCQTDNPEGLAADWARYTNVILQNYRQGQESLMTGEDLRVYNSIADWGGKPKLPTAAEAAIPPVQYWEIGNEPEVPGIHPMLNNHYLSPADYRDRYKSISQAMLAVDPTLKFGPCLIDPGNGASQWLPTLAADPAVRIDFVSYHPYYNGIKNNWGNPEAITSGMRVMKTALNNSAAAIRAVMSQEGRSNYGLVASEWNPVNWDGTSEMQRSVANALAVAETVFTFAEDGVQGGTFWEQPQNKLGPRHMFEALRDYMGDTIVANVETFGLQPDHLDWRVYVTKNSGDDNRLMIWGLNFNDEQNVAIDLALANCRIDSAVLRLYGNPTGDTGLMTSTGMAWTEQPVSGLEASGFTFTIPDAQAAILVLEVTPFSRADFDSDGDVDQSDFGYFQNCLTGWGVPQLRAACQDALLDDDSDVDNLDLDIFMGCMSGPGILADYRCAD